MSSKPVTPPRLVIIEGKEKGKVIPLKTGTVIIGRSKGDVLIQDPRISRSHVAIHFDEKTGRLSFTDLKSLNGTSINGDSIARGELRDGDKLQMGNTTFDCQMFNDDDSADKTELAEPAMMKKRAKGEERKKTLLRHEPDSDLNPLAENSQLEHPEVVHWEAPSESEVEEVTNSPVEKTSSTYIPKWRQWYLKIPARVRNIALGTAFVLGALAYIGQNSPPDPAQIEENIQEAKRLWSEKKWNDSLELAKKTKDLFPNHSAPWMLLGDMYASRENYEEAIAHYRKATELQPPQPPAHTRLLRLYLKTGLSEEAVKELQVVDNLLKEGTKSKPLFVEAAQIFLEFKELNQPSEKIFVLAKALQNAIAPESAIGYKLEAQVLFQQNRANEALAALVAGNKIHPEDEWILENIAFAKLTLEDSNGAMQTVEQWLRIRPEATKALLVMAYLKFNGKNYLGALPYIQRIVQVATTNPSEPHYAEALNLAGQIYYQQNQTAEAEGFLKQSCELGFSRSCGHPILQGKMPASIPDQPSQDSSTQPPVATSPAQPAAPIPAPNTPAELPN